jgi:hypothetical protein
LSRKRLGHPLDAADFVALPWEVMARMRGGQPSRLDPAARQQALDNWRVYWPGMPVPVRRPDIEGAAT